MLENSGAVSLRGWKCEQEYHVPQVDIEVLGLQAYILQHKWTREPYLKNEVNEM